MSILRRCRLPELPRNSVLIAIAATLALLVGGCIASSPEPEPTAPPTPTAQAVPTEAPFIQIPAIQTPAGLVRGGTFRISVPGRAQQGDPHDSIATGVLTWGSGLAYSSLFRFRTGADTPVPHKLTECDLCREWRWRDRLTLEVRLRDNAVWQNIPPLNGRNVTAEDVKWSLDRQAEPGQKSSPLLRNIEDIRVVDAQTLTIHLKQPDVETMEKLAHPGSAIVPREIAEVPGGLTEGTIIGSGPWIITEVSRTAVKAQANGNYYEEGLPYIELLDIQIINHPLTRVSGVRIGILDAALATQDDAESLQQVIRDVEVLEIDIPDDGIEVALNTTNPLLSSLDVRKALFLAMNPEEIIEDVWEGDRFISNGLAPPDPSWSTAGLFEGVFGNRDAALDLLRNTASGEQSTPLVIRVGEFDPAILNPEECREFTGEGAYCEKYIAHARAIADSINDIGIRTSIDRVTTRVFADDVWVGGNYDIFVGASPPIFGLTDKLLSVYHSEGTWNTTGYSTEELDRLITSHASELNSLERSRLFRRIEEAIIEGRHRFNAASSRRYWVSRGCVRDFMPNDLSIGSDFLTSVWLKNCDA